MNDVVAIYVSLISAFISLVAVVYARLSWHRGRTIYELRREVLRMPSGTEADMHDATAHLNEILAEGRWEVVATAERREGDLTIVFGRTTEPKRRWLRLS